MPDGVQVGPRPVMLRPDHHRDREHVVEVRAPPAWLITLDGPSRESLQKPAKEPVERHNAMALDQSALLEALDALKVADVGDRVRQAAETVC